MKEFLVLMQEGDDISSRWYASFFADDADHAEEQALDHDPIISVVAVYERLR